MRYGRGDQVKPRLDRNRISLTVTTRCLRASSTARPHRSNPDDGRRPWSEINTAIGTLTVTTAKINPTQPPPASSAHRTTEPALPVANRSDGQHYRPAPVWMRSLRNSTVTSHATCFAGQPSDQVTGVAGQGAVPVALGRLARSGAGWLMLRSLPGSDGRFRGLRAGRRSDPQLWR